MSFAHQSWCWEADAQQTGDRKEIKILKCYAKSQSVCKHFLVMQKVKKGFLWILKELLFWQQELKVNYCCAGDPQSSLHRGAANTAPLPEERTEGARKKLKMGQEHKSWMIKAS